MASIIDNGVREPKSKQSMSKKTIEHTMKTFEAWVVLVYDILKEKYGVSLDTSVGGVSIADDDGGDFATAVAPVSELFLAAEEETGKNVPF